MSMSMKLAADLSLAKLQARWTAASGAVEVPAGEVGEQPAGRTALWEQATAAAAQAAEQVRGSDGGDLTGADDAAAAAAEVLAAAGRLIEGPAGGPLTGAARDYDRAAREVGGRLAPPSTGGAVLRAAALQLARGGRQPGRCRASGNSLVLASRNSLVVRGVVSTGSGPGWPAAVG